MIIKPATSWLNTDKDPMLVNDTTVVLSAMDANKIIYTAPIPPLPEVQIALDNFIGGLALAADGGPSATARKNARRLILVGLLRQLASYVAVACKNDMTNLLLSGFPTQKPTRQPVGILSPPTNLVVKQGRTGEIFARANGVFGASIYNWTVTNSVTGLVEQTDQTPAVSTSFTGLTPGVIYDFSLNAVGTAGPSDWSSVVSLMVI